MDTTDLFSLAGRTALVTGGSRGIGRMVAEGFIRQGAHVYISARKADACDSTAAELSELGQCTSLPADISTIEGAAELARAFADREPRLDILVNNAGAAWGAPIDAFPESGWDKVMDLNVKAPFFLTQHLLPQLSAATDDHLAKVINIASIDGISLSRSDTFSYQASKAAIVQLTRKMGVELIERRIAVSAIAPGAFASEMNRDARDNAEHVVTHIPAGRIGSAEDMAAAAIYLASRGGDYVVGSTLIVDGGVTHAR